MLRLLAILFVCAANSAVAQIAMPCDGQACADAIVEPWEYNAATFANGAVRMALLDTIEPAAGAAYLLLLHPPMNEMGGRTCTVVGLVDGLGYAAIFFVDLVASYDPAAGLTFRVPDVIFLPEQSFQNSAELKITVNQAIGDIAVTHRLGNE
jgi:hypothetical protein